MLGLQGRIPQFQGAFPVNIIFPLQVLWLRQNMWHSQYHQNTIIHHRSKLASHHIWAKCTTASQPQSLAIFWIAGEIARNFRSEKQIWPFFIAKCIATATVSLPQRNRNLFPRKNRCVQFDRVNESQTSTANHRRETVHLASECTKIVHHCLLAISRCNLRNLRESPSKSRLRGSGKPWRRFPH